jgi:hypothetical protein
MTDPLTPEHAAVVAEPGSRLEQLAEAYAIAKPAADAAKGRLEEITAALKLALSEAAPGAHKVDFTATALDAPLRLAAKTSWRLDTTRLKAEVPHIYVQYAKQATYWELRAVAGRGQS